MRIWGGEYVFTSEWDKYCQITYHENFGDTPHGDITKIPIKDIPKHDVLLAVFPCQPFSKSGFATRKFLNKKDGFADDTQGQIFFRIAKIIAEKKPKAIFLENVPRLVKMNKGKTFDAILTKLKKLGYDCKWKVISAETVVPQRRERLYIVATRKGIDFKFPEIPEYTRPTSLPTDVMTMAHSSWDQLIQYEKVRAILVYNVTSTGVLSSYSDQFSSVKFGDLWVICNT